MSNQKWSGRTEIYRVIWSLFGPSKGVYKVYMCSESASKDDLHEQGYDYKVNGRKEVEDGMTRGTKLRAIFPPLPPTHPGRPGPSSQHCMHLP